MVKLTVLYPYADGDRFDHDYYRVTHVPMAHDIMGSSRWEIDTGISGAAPGSKPPFHALAHFYFDSLEALQGGLGKGGSKLGDDMPNYTNVVPAILFSDVIEG